MNAQAKQTRPQPEGKVGQIFEEACKESPYFGFQWLKEGLSKNFEVFVAKAAETGVVLTEEDIKKLLPYVKGKKYDFFQGWVGGPATGGSRYHKYDFQTLRYVATGGSIMSPVIEKEFETEESLLRFLLENEGVKLG